MTLTQELAQEKTKKVSKDEIQQLIDKAVQKLGVSKENDICRYIPGTAGGYIHHFTMRKMKGEDPEQLAGMIKKHILNAPAPEKVHPKARAARGSRKPRNQLFFSKNDIERLLKLALISGDKDIIRKLTPQKDLRSIKRELIASIRHNRVEQDLWATYVEILSHQSNNFSSSHSSEEE